MRGKKKKKNTLYKCKDWIKFLVGKKKKKDWIKFNILLIRA